MRATKITIESGGKFIEYEMPETADSKIPKDMVGRISVDQVARNQDITVFVGVDLVLWRRNGEWWGKDSWCDKCGLCCIILRNPDWPHGTEMKEWVPGSGVRIPVCKKLEIVDYGNGRVERRCSDPQAMLWECKLAYTPTGYELPYCAVKMRRLEPGVAGTGDPR